MIYFSLFVFYFFDFRFDLYSLLSSAYTLFFFCPHLAPFSVFLFRATPAAYGTYQGRGRMGTAAAGLCHSHSNTRSKLHLGLTPQWQCQILNPLSEARDQICILMDTSWVLNLLSHNRNSVGYLLLCI